MFGTNFRALFIKLGESGEWEEECIKSASTIRLGFGESSHEICEAGNWSEIQKFYRETEQKTARVATGFTNQIKMFYEEPKETIWITFYAGRLWWANAAEKVIILPGNIKERNTLRGWSSLDAKNQPLVLNTLSGKLLKTRGFRGTICEPQALEYLQRRLNGERMPEVLKAIELKHQMVDAMIPVIQSLSDKDFELLIDLIFRHGGWQRAGVIGGTEKDVDLYLYSPITNQRIAIQIKSTSDPDELRKYISKLSEMSDLDQCYFVVHTGKMELLRSVQLPPNFTFLAGRELGELAVRAGLIEWLIDKAG